MLVNRTFPEPQISLCVSSHSFPLLTKITPSPSSIPLQLCSVMSGSLRLHGLQSTRLPCPWNSPGENIGVGCYFLLQGIFPTQGPNPDLLGLLHWQVDSLPLSHQGSPHLLRWFNNRSLSLAHVCLSLFLLFSLF